MYTEKKYVREALPKGTSEKALAIHQDKLYVGYVKKMNEIALKLAGVDLASANQSYSDLRSLKDGETFSTNGVYLHEYYFSVLSDSEVLPTGVLLEGITTTFGSLQRFVEMFSACGMAARGWVVLGWDTHTGALKIYCGDAHNQGGVWGTIPLLVLDVYEHAYFMDYGSDRKTYITDFMSSINWKPLEEKFEKINKLIV